jgi:hypothetical protein
VSAMSKRAGLFSDIEQLVAQVRPDDGVDPRDEAKRRRPPSGEPRPGLSHGVHKQEQLVSEVQKALDIALQCAAAPLLNELTVQDVAKQGGTFAVVVGPRNPDQAIDLAATSLALEKARPMLTHEVASSINRKEAPRLSFIVLPAGAQRVEE